MYSPHPHLSISHGQPRPVQAARTTSKCRSQRSPAAAGTQEHEPSRGPIGRDQPDARAGIHAYQKGAPAPEYRYW